MQAYKPKAALVLQANTLKSPNQQRFTRTSHSGLTPSKVFLFILSFLLGTLLTTSIANAQATDTPDVSMQAQLIVDSTDATVRRDGILTVTANIKEGLHIYAQSQPKPFLATKVSLNENVQVQLAGKFKPERAPISIRHQDLNVQLHEFEGTIRWSAPIVVAAGTDLDDLNLTGNVFAQACEAERCFAPQTYDFNVDIVLAQKSIGVDSEAGKGASQGQTRLGDDVTVANTGRFSLDQLATQERTSNSLSIYAVLPLAFVAGFILNFMPCVLPVVGLKVLSFVQQADNNRQRIFLLNLSYALGTISVLLVLATLATFAGLGWGEQFSSVSFTVVLTSIVFAFALSFLGVWEIGVPGAVGQIGGKEEGLAGAFSKGILSTVLATPCSGPFLGSALAWALVQPAQLTYLVFGTVGLGMASPFLVIGVFPKLVKWLPKPGAWMVSFKKLMGFVLIGTTVFLLSFISIPALVPTLALLTIIGAACWVYGQHDMTKAGSAWKRLAAASFMVLVAAWFSFGWLYNVSKERFERAAIRYVESHSAAAFTALDPQAKSDDQIPWQTYSEESLQSALDSGKTVFVDFTADWCLTCKANESIAINKPDVAKLIRNNEIVAFRADKTEPAPQVDKLLRQLGNQSASIPFYAVFPKGSPDKPITLDGVFSSSQPVLAALGEAS
jgi:thiol:disulfide interchange protein DsbD